MAILNYVKSMAMDDSVSKQQVFRFLEMEFARADKDHDGKLSFEELETFARAISCADREQK
jgi:hypothetical protein